MKNSDEMMKMLLDCGKISMDDVEAMIEAQNMEVLMREYNLKELPKITERNKNGVIQYYTVVPARLSKSGKRHQIVAKTEKECRKRLMDEMIEVAEAAKIKTVNSVMEEFLHIKKGNIKPQTLSGYHGYYTRHIKKTAFGQLNIEGVEPTECQKFVSSLYDKKLSHATISKIKSVISLMFDYAVSKKYVLINPIHTVKINENLCASTRCHETGAWTDDEIKQMWDFTLDWWKEGKHREWYFHAPAFMFMMFTGCRAGELAAATWDDVDFEKREFHIDKTHAQYADVETGEYILENSTTKTVQSRRTILLNDAAMFWLGEIKRRAEYFKIESSYITATQTGKVLSPANVDCRLQKFCKAAGLKRYMSSHSLRKTYATFMIDSGIVISEVSADLGHKNITTTQNVYYKRRNNPTVIMEKKNEAILATLGNRLEMTETL